MSRLLFAAFLLFFAKFSYSQCDDNLIKNGSFELDTIGRNIVGSHWMALSGSPDLDNAMDNFPSIGSNVIWTSQVLSSCDGGNWQNIGRIEYSDGDITNESFGQEVQLKKSVPHILEFEFASQTFAPSFPGLGYSSVDVYINDELKFTTHVDTTLFTWEKVDFIFVPDQKNIFIHFEINPILNLEYNVAKYVAIDGICLTPIEMGMFCNP